MTPVILGALSRPNYKHKGGREFAILRTWQDAVVAAKLPGLSVFGQMAVRLSVLAERRNVLSAIWFRDDSFDMQAQFALVSRFWLNPCNA